MLRSHPWKTLSRRWRCLAVSGALVLYASAAAGQAVTDDGFKGQGAALCIAAGELLSAQPGADANLRDHVSAWRQILHVMDGTEARRQAALEEARSSLAATRDGDARRANRAAQVTWSVACGTRDLQIKYLAVHASEERRQNHLVEEPGTSLDPEAVHRLNISGLCFAGAEFFLQPKPSRPLRSAFQNATPPIPDGAMLRSIRDRAHKEVDSAPGSTAGKSLLLDYFRFLHSGASGGSNPQRFVDRTSRRLSERCHGDVLPSSPS